MDFDTTPYTEIRKALAKSGIKCGISGRHQVTVSVQDREIWPDSGNSFWITVATGYWCLFTWAPVGYRIPPGTDILDLCRKCMAIGDTAMYRLPDEIFDAFGLVELTEEEADVVYTATETAK
ncbi:hypothetical protein LOC67_24580 [Stieleria sp. JC731]|uniref:hypothetical protein n=1 Tax=Pirellulaceae TaxID=2691357 RepID=UPI001E5B8210|nr:hypothetical protein [Stieleria sp. JC731]MCC9603739.1 hypothetical protein [Stieleria sp. JC731]